MIGRTTPLRSCLLAICILILGFSAAYAAEFSLIVEPEGQQAVVQRQMADPKGPFKSAQRWRRVDLLNRLAQADGIAVGDELVLNLFADAAYHATIDRVAVNSQGTVTVRGRLRDYPLGYVLITTTGDRSLATIRVPELRLEYTILFDQDSQRHYLLDQDPAGREKLVEAPPVRPRPPKPEEQREIETLRERIQLNQALADTPATVDVLVVYTPAARSWAVANEGSIANTITQAMEKGQLAADNSNTLLTVNLVHSAEVSYTETGDAGIDLGRLQNPSDGWLDSVHTLRNTYGADLVVLLEHIEDAGGIGYLLESLSGEPAWAFSITRVQQASWTYTTIHEIGHNMGLSHHKLQNTEPGPGIFSYSAGWRWTSSADGGHYCSIMTYESGAYFADRIRHDRVAYFSNPSIAYLGTATGHAADGDNARTLRETKAVVAAYRQATPSCTYSLNPTTATFGTSAGTGTVAVTASAASCSWTAVSNDTAWLTVTAGSSGTGSGTVSYSVAANATGSGRTGTMTIAGQSFTVTQNSATLLYFPHVDTNFPWRTEIALINTSPAQTVTGTLRGYSNAGGPPVSTLAGVTLSPRGRRQITVSEEFPNPAAIGYIVFESSAATVQGYTKFSQDGVYRAAVPAVKEINTGNIIVPHIDSSASWWTGISLVNTTASQKVLTITFNTNQSVQRTLAAGQHDAFSIRDLFGGQPQPLIESAVITGASGVIGLELFGSQDGSNQLDGILLTDDTAFTLTYPHVVGDPWWTGIVAYNPSDLSCTLTITPYELDGDPLTPQIVPLAGKEKYIGTVGVNLLLPAGTAWFRIESTRPLVGFELFGTGSGTAKQLAAYGGGGAGSTAGVFPKIEKNGGWTGIAFVNAEAVAASVTLTAYTDAGGAPVATRVLPLGGHTKVVELVEDIFSGQNIGSATYVAYSSTRTVVGFQINGSADNTLLDGLPGLPN